MRNFRCACLLLRNGVCISSQCVLCSKFRKCSYVLICIQCLSFSIQKCTFCCILCTGLYSRFQVLYVLMSFLGLLSKRPWPFMVLASFYWDLIPIQNGFLCAVLRCASLVGTWSSRVVLLLKQKYLGSLSAVYLISSAPSVVDLLKMLVVWGADALTLAISRFYVTCTKNCSTVATEI